MSTYHVSFFKNLLSSDGHPFKCLQRRIDVSDAESDAQAAEFCVENVRSALRMSLEAPCGFDRDQCGPWSTLHRDAIKHSCHLATGRQ